MTRTEDLASRGMGQAKAVKATFKGLKGIFKTLMQEHGEASALLKRISVSHDPQVRARLFPQVRDALLRHERGEMRVLYPALREYNETRSIAEEHDREGKEMEALLDTLSRESYESGRWEATFRQLVELVEHHTSQEEGSYFPTAQNAVGIREAERLDQRYRSNKDGNVNAQLSH